MERDARSTVGRDYCRGCERRSVQMFAGYATADGRENTIRPRAFYRQCKACGTTRLVLQNVTDAEGLCRKTLKGWLDRHPTGAAVGATGQPYSDGALDADDALAFLQETVWDLYLGWQPSRSEGSFLAYASGLLPKRLATWSRDASGEASDRSKGRRFPKAHAASVSESLDGLRDAAADRRGESDDGRADSRPHTGLGGFTVDHAEAGSPDLLRALTAGGGRRARADGEHGFGADDGFAAQDRAA